MDKEKLDTVLRYERLKQASDKSLSGRLVRLERKIGLVRRLPASRHVAQKCDILFLHLYDEGIARTEALWRPLEDLSLTVAHEVLTARNIVKKRMIAKADKGIPRELRFESGLAQYLVARYMPRMICTFMDAVPLVSFLRHEMKGRGTCVNIAHCMTDTSHLFSMFDFDYYFAFGRGSLENMLRNPLRIGSTKVVLTGSPFIGSHFALPPNTHGKDILFFSACTPGPIKEPMINTMELVVEWARTHREYTLHVKLHPLEDPSFFAGLAGDVKNIRILPKQTPMIDALEPVSLVLSNFSSASIEAALLGRPTVVVSNSSFPNHFNLEDFFLPRAKDVEGIQHNVQDTLKNFDHFLEKTREFTHYHLEHTTDSVSFMVKCLKSILEGREDFPYTVVEEELKGLDRY